MHLLPAVLPASCAWPPARRRPEQHSDGTIVQECQNPLLHTAAGICCFTRRQEFLLKQLARFVVALCNTALAACCPGAGAHKCTPYTRCTCDKGAQLRSNTAAYTRRA
eukprot:351809-Chlamydomonas_euryale.AAC.4